MGGSLLLLMGLFVQPANAWEHLGTVWDDADFPLQWYIADQYEDSMNETDQVEALQNAWDNWNDGAPCARLSDETLGIREDYYQGFNADGTNTFTFDDPDQDLGTGVLAATLCHPNGEYAFTLNGDSYYYIYDCDIVYNVDLDWGSTDDIDDGSCSSEYSLEAVSTHEIGHLWGLAHSCEEGESCTDPDLRYATMYWSTGPCTNFQTAVNEDDVESINSLYGPYCSFEASDDSERYGGEGLEVCFDLTCNEDVETVSWDFGDGNTSSETDPCHTYEDKGQFTVNMTISGEGEDCGQWDYTQYERAYVLVCGAPEPGIEFDSLFTYEHTESGLIYQMVNQTDTSVYGCIDQVQWDVFKNGKLDQSISAWSPKIEFDAEASYKVVLNVAGPGGVSAAELTIDAVDMGDGSGFCATAPLTAGLFGILSGLGAAVRRRRDS